MNRLSVALLSALALSSVVAADQGRIEIGPTNTFPIVIDTPGSYVLTADLHMAQAGVSAIEITADQVNLDLGGHVVRGPGAGLEAYGIRGYNRTGITVHNGTVTGFTAGVVITEGSSGSGVHRFHDLVISEIGYGPGLAFHGGSAHDIVVREVSVTSLPQPALSCINCTLTNVTVRSSFEGIALSNGSAMNCSAIGNGTGFILRDASLTGGAAIDNSGYGVRAVFRSTVVGVTVSGNGAAGIRLVAGGSNNAVNCAGGDNAAGNITGCDDGNGCHQNYLP